MVGSKLLVLTLTIVVCAVASHAEIHKDRPFIQDFSTKVPLSVEVTGAKLSKVRADRNGRICVLFDKGLLEVHSGQLRPSRLHRPLGDMQIRDFDVTDGQFIYLTDKEVLSNAWAGELLVEHGEDDVASIVPGNRSCFLLASEGKTSSFDNGLWRDSDLGILGGVFDAKRNRFLVLTDDALVCLESGKSPSVVLERDGMTCLTLDNRGWRIIVGTSTGLLLLDVDSFKQVGGLLEKLPCADIRCIAVIEGKLWCGTSKGAFAWNRRGRIDYYASKRWLIDDIVIDIAPGPNGSVLVLTESGLSIIHFQEMTLAEKADHFDELTRQRHIRYGFNSAFVMTESGDFSTGYLVDQDNDGLWTAMYLAGELFRYAVTQSDDTYRNCLDSFEAMERLTTITPMDGFPARAIERGGYQVADKQHWHPAADGHWVWKGTTSSDEIVGHFFAYTLFAEIIEDPQWKQRAVTLMDSIMDHIVRNNWYLIDYDGKPTLWGRWHPEYVNKFPRQVGDRRLNSVEIISFLQAAYHFTGKEIYKEKAYGLLDDHGYLDNIMTPITEIGRVPGIDLTTDWNHSDDELAFLSYWNLYRYAFTDELKDKYRQSIKEHWEVERPEKNPLWSFIYADTGAEQFDLDEAIWSLQEFPLDTISWTVTNSHRKDLEFIEPNFRDQTTNAVLPPDERPMSKYNGNAFRLDGGRGGKREYSGDIYTLPYWMGRYLGVIE